jgi:hypothetical protein
MSSSSDGMDWDGTEVELSVTFHIRYRVEASDYEGCETLAQAMAIDVHNGHDNPMGTVLLGDDAEADVEVNWRKT